MSDEYCLVQYSYRVESMADVYNIIEKIRPDFKGKDATIYFASNPHYSDSNFLIVGEVNRPGDGLSLCDIETAIKEAKKHLK